MPRAKANKITPVVASNASELARALGMKPAAGHRWELRSQLVSKIAEIVEKEGLTHAELAHRVKTSRTRVTSILNRNIDDVSTDLLLRILESLGYRISISITRQKVAA